MICLRDKDTDINPCKELVRNLLCKSMLSTTTYLFFTIIDKSFCFFAVSKPSFCTTSFPRMLLIQQATYPFILIFSPTQQASLWGDYRRPHKEYQFKHLFRAINIIIVVTSTQCWFLVFSFETSSLFSPLLFFTTVFSLSSYDESGGYVSLSLHIVFYSTLLYSPLYAIHWYLLKKE